jgi:hypothetical protein
VSLTEDHKMIEALTPDRSDQPFCEAILPRCSRCYRFVSDAHCTNVAQGELAIDAIVISDEVARRLIPGECLRELARKPFCSRILCHVNPEQLSPVQPDYDEGIKQAEPDGRDYEQNRDVDLPAKFNRLDTLPMRSRLLSAALSSNLTVAI